MRQPTAARMTEQPAPADSSLEDRRALSVSVASLVFALGAPVVYASARAFEQLRGMASDPTLIIRALHTAYYWRAALSLWAAGLLALVVFATLRGETVDQENAARRLRVFALVVVPCTAAFLWFMP